jgi:hypothetical protein
MFIFVRYVTRTPENKSCCFSPKVYSFFKCVIKITGFVEDEGTAYLHVLEALLKS